MSGRDLTWRAGPGEVPHAVRRGQSRTVCGLSVDARWGKGQAPSETDLNVCSSCLRTWGDETPEGATVRDVRAAASASDRKKALAVLVAIGAFFIGGTYVVGSILLGGGDNDGRDGPSGKYSEDQCATLRFVATGDGSESEAEDALVEYTVHCE